MNVGREYDLDLNDATESQIKEMGRNIILDNMILLRNQNIDEKRIGEVCDAIGQMHDMSVLPFRHPDYPYLCRVTNELIGTEEETELRGFFATEELGWHSNGNTRPLDKVKQTCVAFFMVRPGINSITSFLDSRRVLNELPDNIREEVENLEGWYEFENRTFYDFKKGDKELDMFGQEDWCPNQKGSWKSLVLTHPQRLLGKNQIPDSGLYFAHHFIHKFRDKTTEEEFTLEDKKELWDYLMKHFYQEKYIYHHHWREGDIIFNDQFLSFHKRNKPKGKRLLYRVGLNYKNL